MADYNDGLKFEDGTLMWYSAKTPVDVQTTFGDTLSISGSSEEGYVITLNNFNFTTDFARGLTIIDKNCSTIVLKGENTITAGTEGDTFRSGLRFDFNPLTIEGEGENVTFSVTSGNYSYSEGIHVKDLIINGDITLTAKTLGTGENAFAIRYTEKSTPTTLDVTDTEGNKLTFNGEVRTYTDDQGNIKNPVIMKAGVIAPEVTVLTEKEWFNADDKTVTVNGTIVDHSGKGIKSFTVEVGGAQPVELEITRVGTSNEYEWNYTYGGKDTEGTNLSFTATDENDQTGKAQYLLKVDTVAPTVTIAESMTSKADYVDKATGISWYTKREQDGFITAVGTDNPGSGIDYMIVDDIPQMKGAAGVNKTLYLTEEMDEAASYEFGAKDVAGNETEDVVTFTYNVDGTGPTIAEVFFVGDEGKMYYDEVTDVTWFKMDSSAALAAEIKDTKSGLASANYAEIPYDTDKKLFTLDTTVEVQPEEYNITATDNVGNESDSPKYAYAVDGSAPVIVVTEDPDLPLYAGSVAVFAAMDDGEGSGIKTKQYAINGGDFQDYNDSVVITGDNYVGETCIITFKAVDNVGYETTKDYQVVNVDLWTPVIDLYFDNTTVSAEQFLSAYATDEHTKVVAFQYKFGEDGEWTDYDNGQEITVDANGTYYFRAEDVAGNKTETSVTYYNITAPNAETFTVIGDDKVIVDKQSHKNVIFEAGSTLTITETGSLYAGTLSMNGSNVLANFGSADAEKLIVSGTGNVISGDLDGVAAIAMKDAELTLSKDLYDSFMDGANFQSAGKLIVEASEANSLTPDDINDIFLTANVDDVKFNMNLINIGKMTFNAGKAMTVGFEDGYGTDKGDTIRFAKNSDITLGTEGGTIDLLAGNNKVQIDKDADVEINSNLANVSTVKSAKGSGVTTGDISFQLGRNATLKAEGKSFLAGDITGTDKATTLSASKGTQFFSGDITLGARNDKITTGTDSIFVGEAIDFGAGNDTLKIGKDAYFNVYDGIDFGGGKDKIEVASCSKGNDSAVVLKADKDGASSLTKFTIGKNAVAYLSSELIDKGEALNKNFAKNATVYDIGEFNVAKNFTDIADERSDNEAKNARLLETADYAGWLNDIDGKDDQYEDLMDFLTNGTGSDLTLDLGKDYTSFGISTDGGINWATAEASTLDFAAGTTIGIAIWNDDRAFAYSVKAAQIA